MSGPGHRSIAVNHAMTAATFLVPATAALAVIGFTPHTVGTTGTDAVLRWTALGATPLLAAGVWFLALAVSAFRDGRRSAGR